MAREGVERAAGVQLAQGVGGQARLTDRLSATLDASTARYPTGTVTSVQPGLVVDVLPERLQLAARWIVVRDESGEDRQGCADDARAIGRGGIEPAIVGVVRVVLIAERGGEVARVEALEADRVRDELTAMGIVLKDSATGTTWERG